MCNANNTVLFPTLHTFHLPSSATHSAELHSSIDQTQLSTPTTAGARMMMRAHTACRGQVIKAVNVGAFGHRSSGLKERHLSAGRQAIHTVSSTFHKPAQMFTDHGKQAGLRMAGSNHGAQAPRCCRLRQAGVHQTSSLHLPFRSAEAHGGAGQCRS